MVDTTEEEGLEEDAAEETDVGESNLETSGEAVLSDASGEILLSEAFNDDERVDLVFKGGGSLEYYINEVQVFGGEFEEGEKVRLIVKNNSRLVLGETLTADMYPVQASDTDITNLSPGIYLAEKDFEYGTYLVNIDIKLPPASIVILDGLDSLEIIEQTLVDEFSGNGIQYSIDKDQVIVFENANSISMEKVY